jgi:hypothetical protein
MLYGLVSIDIKHRDTNLILLSISNLCIHLKMEIKNYDTNIANGINNQNLIIILKQMLLMVSNTTNVLTHVEYHTFKDNIIQIIEDVFELGNDDVEYISKDDLKMLKDILNIDNNKNDNDEKIDNFDELFVTFLNTNDNNDEIESIRSDVSKLLLDFAFCGNKYPQPRITKTERIVATIKFLFCIYVKQ